MPLEFDFPAFGPRWGGTWMTSSRDGLFTRHSSAIESHRPEYGHHQITIHRIARVDDEVYHVIFRVKGKPSCP